MIHVTTCAQSYRSFASLYPESFAEPSEICDLNRGGFASLFLVDWLRALDSDPCALEYSF